MAVALPTHSMICGFGEALSTSVTSPVYEPTAGGSNTTLIVHSAPADSELPHVVLSLKLPDTLIELIERRDSPSLVRVTVCSALFELISCVGKESRSLGKKFTTPVLSIVIAPRKI